MSGGSFDYLCFKDLRGEHTDLVARMRMAHAVAAREGRGA